MSDELSDRLRPGEFLVCYDYGMGGLWGVLIAPSRESITAKYPELDVVVTLPPAITSADVERWRGEPVWLDDEPPQGLLRALLADRQRN